ncbi:MAG: flippase-like domain-containing protein [Desulfofustis sp.]|nr:flippase-like domain-containing protein [Desulfofustis sp.]
MEPIKPTVPRRRLNRAWHQAVTRWRLLAMIVGLILLGQAVQRMNWTEVGQLLSAIDPLSVVAIAACNLLMLPLMSMRWWLILIMLDTPVNLLRVSFYRTAAGAVSYLTPGPHFGGEPVSVFLLNVHHRIGLSVGAASVGVDRLLELTVSFAVLAICIGSLSLALPHVAGSVGAVLAVLAVLALCLTLLVQLFREKKPFSQAMHQLSAFTIPASGFRMKLGRFARFLKDSEDLAAAMFVGHPFRFICAILLSLAGWVAVFAELWLISFVLGTPLTLMELAGLTAIARLAFFTPLPAGLGVLEFGLPWVTASYGLGGELGFGICLVIRLRDLANSLIGGGLLMKYLTCAKKRSIINNIA